jgi:hypothetical protein
VTAVDIPKHGAIWYLPHHNVMNPRKPEKFRVVYDCAAKHGHVSLNDKVSQGPDLTNNMLGVLVRFRENRVAMMGDIKGMFLQVKVPPDQRDFLRFLWWNDGDIGNSLVTYRMTVHLFGGVWSSIGQPMLCCVLPRTIVINTLQRFFLL